MTVSIADTLTIREVEIVKLICDGLTDKDVALKLCLSTSTVRTHRKSILKKLNITKTVLLVRFAIEQGLIQ